MNFALFLFLFYYLRYQIDYEGFRVYLNVVCWSFV